MPSTCELWLFMMMIRSYEPGIVDIIFKCIKSHTFKTKKELQEAVNLWCENREECINKYGHISDWDVSLITNMCELFRRQKTFNDNISRWDVSSVTDMYCMFYSATKFNQPIGDWNVSRVTNMYGMFKYAREYNQPIGDWDVSNVKNIHSMFFEASKFNQPIGKWVVSNVVDMTSMFICATKFDLENNLNEYMKSKMSKHTSHIYNITYNVYASYGHIRNMDPKCMSIDINKPNYISIQSYIQKDYYYSWDFSNINNIPKRINNKLKYQRDRNTRYQNKHNKLYKHYTGNRR
jgi:surface protein